MPGVEFHANFLEGLFAHEPLRPFSDTATAVLCVLVSLASCAVFAHAKISRSILYAGAFFVLLLLL